MYHHARALLVLAAVLIAGAAWAQEQTPGWLGVGFQNITKEDAEKLGWDRPRGATITRPSKGSPAAKKGLEPGEVIATLDGIEVEDQKSLLAALKSKPPGAVVTLGLVRPGKVRTVAVALGALPEVYALHDQVWKLIQAGKHSEAMPIAQRALALGEELFDPDDANMGQLLVHLALLHDLQGRATDAEPFYRRPYPSWRGQRAPNFKSAHFSTGSRRFSCV
jgi:hypothetical protein